MGQPVVIIPTEQPVDNDASAAFAAGVAAATAVQAEGTAAEAVEVAEAAAAVATEAQSRATEADVAALSAEARIELLTDRVDELVEFIGDHFNPAGETAAAELDETAPPVVTVEVNTTGKDPEPTPTKARRERGGTFGSDAWWGTRR